MSQSGRPAAAAVVAAPIRKLRPAYWSSLKPNLCSKDRSIEVRRRGVRKDPSACENNGRSDALDLERAMYFSNAFTGQTEWCDRLRNRSTPKQNGSVLDSSMCSRYPLLSITEESRIRQW